MAWLFEILNAFCFDSVSLWTHFSIFISHVLKIPVGTLWTNNTLIRECRTPSKTTFHSLFSRVKKVKNMRGLLVAVGRCDTQVRLSLIYVSGNFLRPLVPRIPLRMVLRSVTHKQDARIVDKVYWWMLQSSKLLSVFKPDTLSGVLTLFNDHNLSYSRTGPEDT